VSPLISLKRHIDAEHTSSDLLRALAEAYQNTLNAVGASAAQACPSVESGLDTQLARLGKEIAGADKPATIAEASEQVSDRLEQWAEEAEAAMRRKTAEVKELLVTLAHTASSVAASDAEHVIRFDALTARLEKIATLDDVSQLKSAVLASASELRASVDTMSKSTRTALKEMQSELNEYQSKLEVAEKMAAHDLLTDLMNRRKIETLIERRIQRGKSFSIGLIDLDGFKAVNDKLGHAAGDDLLRQFSADLKANSRATDTVGRWGGDEFIVICDGSLAEAEAHFRRLQEWVGGSYQLDGPQGKIKVDIGLSIGATEWRTGTSAAALIQDADTKMYAAKRSRR
jgi:two-component system, sensor histidine kinase LadS